MTKQEIQKISLMIKEFGDSLSAKLDKYIELTEIIAQSNAEALELIHQKISGVQNPSEPADEKGFED